MVKVVATSGTLNISAWDIGTLADADVTSHSSTKVVLSDPPDQFTFTGTGFSSFDSNNIPHKGTITGAVVKNALGTTTITGGSVSVASFVNDVIHNNTAAFVTALLSGNDTLIGGAKNDIITGYHGADTLTGGNGVDTFTYTAASDSTGKVYDTITDFNGSQDKIDVKGTIGAIDTAIGKGALASTKFDAQLTAATASLGKHHAVEFTASSGNLKGEHFLVVDLNGKVGYQSGADLVIHLGDNSINLNHLSTHDFV